MSLAALLPAELSSHFVCWIAAESIYTHCALCYGDLGSLAMELHPGSIKWIPNPNPHAPLASYWPQTPGFPSTILGGINPRNKCCIQTETSNLSRQEQNLNQCKGPFGGAYEESHPTKAQQTEFPTLAI